MEKLYQPYQDSTKLVKLMKRARETNTEMSVLDKKAGLVTPEDSAIDEHLRTAMCAISSGLGTLKTDDASSVDCLAQGLSMLEDVELKLRKLNADPLPLSSQN